MNIAYFHVTD